MNETSVRKFKALVSMIIRISEDLVSVWLLGETRWQLHFFVQNMYWSCKKELGARIHTIITTRTLGHFEPLQMFGGQSNAKVLFSLLKDARITDAWVTDSWVTDSWLTNYWVTDLGNKCLGNRFLGTKCLGNRLLGNKCLGNRFLGHKCLGNRFLANKCLGNRFLVNKWLGNRFG